MDEKALVRALDNLEQERIYENVLIGGIFSIMVVMVMLQAIPRAESSKLEVTSLGYPAIAGNTGLVWIQVTPLGQPNQVRIISENSTGAFEEVLLGLTT